MRKFAVALWAILPLWFTACASQDGAVPAVPAAPAAPAAPETAGVPAAGPAHAPAYSPGSLSLDDAIGDIAAYFTGRLPEDTMLAIVSVEADTGSLGDYIFEELWTKFEDSGKFIMLDRRNLERIRTEMEYQMSGAVSDTSARSIGRQYGAQYIIYGRFSSLGNEYRLTAYAADVEKASSSQRALTVKPDSRLSSLLIASLDDQIDRALAAMARGLDGPTTIAVGRISYSGTQTVSSLSAYLKDRIGASAQKQRDKFLVASDSESAGLAVATRGLTLETPPAGSSIQAVVLGSFSPLEGNAEVSLRLVSTGGNRLVLASTEFVIPRAELERRRLSLLPEKDGELISRAEFEAKQKALEPYEGKNNRFRFTVSPDDLDGVYHDGEYMSMQIYSGQDCYFRIVHVDVNGTAQLIYPAAAQDDNFIRAGETRRIPDHTRFRMGAPYGEEYILVAAYDRPFRTGVGWRGLVSDSAFSRGLVVEPEGTQGAEMSPLAAAKFSYTILRGEF
jgi:hypothetical protein